MPSLLTWIDHDPVAQERAMRILSFMNQKESRDELGLGSIRDSFADAFFPGTSTIQTHLKYMLFVPWIYQELEKKRVTAPQFAARARIMELGLVEPLIAGSEEQEGIFGSVAGKGLKRLPSSVYWNGLGVWGIRKINCSQGEYHRHIAEIYRRRENARLRIEKDDSPETGTQTWHPRIPDPPEGFPDAIKNISFNLTLDEANFLRDRLVKSNPESLLVYLVLNCKPVDCRFVWHHPEMERFPAKHRELLNYAEMFSTLMHGSGFLYNLMLAELADRKELQTEHRENIADWQKRLFSCNHINLPLERIWDLTTGRGHVITEKTKEFVRQWHQRVLAKKGDVADDEECRLLIKNREMRLKGSRSRFTNKASRDNWRGYAGVGQLSYRWPNVKIFLAELYVGLNGGDHAQS